MSQLVVKGGRNAARQAKRFKEVRKVQGAIVWHEKERKKRQKLYQERWETKQAAIQRMKWENDNVKKVRRKALNNIREDWRLGNLRPNRAFGEEAEKYGALTSEQIQKPDIPVHTQRNKNENRIKNGLEPEYPLVVDDQKYFHIEKDDRVVVINGREKGKIGIVKDVVERTHDIIVTGVNMQYYDSDVFNTVGEDMGPKRESEVPMPISDVRLVIPYETTQIKRTINPATGLEEERPRKVIQDVIVDEVRMIQHTTGIDPFTGTNHGAAEIPKHHQKDPRTGLPIFHRYVAGTSHRIQWPWEVEKPDEDSEATVENPADRRGFSARAWDTVKKPIASLSFLRPKKPTVTTTSKENPEKPINHLYRSAIDKYKQASRNKPKSKDPGLHEAFDGTDTTRNIVEDPYPRPSTLNAPPFPDTIGEELRRNTSEFNAEARKDGDAPRRVKVKRSGEASETAKAKHVAAQRMKTPMQLRWETEQVKKAKMMKETPLVSTEQLMKALGKHMRAQRGAKTSGKKVEKVEDVE